jgi:hypothetical protein
MSMDDRPQSPQPSAGGSRRGLMMAALISGLAIVVVAIALTRDPEPAAKEQPSAPISSGIAATTTSIPEEDEVIARLRDILKARDRAYRARDVDLLKQVYTTDCPCLRGDGDAIRQLLKDNAVWRGVSTSIRINKLEKVNDRLWVVNADFVASTFRIETESGNLIRAVEERSEPFRFVLRLHRLATMPARPQLQTGRRGAAPVASTSSWAARRHGTVSPGPRTKTTRGSSAAQARGSPVGGVPRPRQPPSR